MARLPIAVFTRPGTTAAAVAKCQSKWRAALHGGGERAVVEVVELAADRHAVCEPRHLRAGAGELIGDVVRGGLALHRGVHGEDDFRNAAAAHAAVERADVEVVRADSVER